MKKVIVVFVILGFNTVLPQYFQERSTEQNFEQSELYFSSHYLNPFGLSGFKEISAGLIDNPFLNLRLNPANLPQFKDKNFLLYLDFRGDRTEASYLDDYYVHPFYYVGIPRTPIDRRWVTITRAEPEPIASFGILINPISGITNNFFLGGTYQFIRRNENFYDMPYGIYMFNYYYDSFGIRTTGEENIPIVDRFSGKDEMTNEGHLFSLFTGYQLFENLSVGLGFNGVIHSREGEHLNSYQDEYGSTNNWRWNSYQSQAREQKYDHLDFNIGVKYNPIEHLSLGVKGGYLKGDADQNYSSAFKHLSQNNIPGSSPTWHYSLSDASTIQNWNQDGNTKYLGVDLKHVFKDETVVRAYYFYNTTEVDLKNNSEILDTSFYSNRWTYDTTWYFYTGYSATIDRRTGMGIRSKKTHEAMISAKFKLTERSTLTTGFYFRSLSTKVNSTEPAFVYRISSHNSSSYTGSYSFNYFQKLIEDKTLVWDYTSDITTVKIPVILNFKLSDNWDMDIGIVRVADAWNIEDVTTAYFKKRERTDIDSTRIETNFGERYKLPNQKISEDYLKFFSSFDVKLSDKFNTRVMIEPEFSPFVRVAQWWIAFEVKL